MGMPPWTQYTSGANISSDTQWVSRPGDFDEFWAETVSSSSSLPALVSVAPVATELATVDAWDLTFRGFEGSKVKAWLKVPRNVDPANLPVCVEFVGYGGGRGRLLENLEWTACGFAHLIMDSRGQGSGWSAGETNDAWAVEPHHPGFLTLGLHKPEDYYYRRLFVDAVRLIDAVGELGWFSTEKYHLHGRSQGAATAIAASALRPGAVSSASYLVPFFCDVPRAIVLATDWPYLEIVNYFRVHYEVAEAALRTLAYFDGVNFAERVISPAMYSIASRDEVAPAACALSAYERHAGPKKLVRWPYSAHEGGGIVDISLAIAFAREVDDAS